MKKTLLALLILVAAFSLSACGKNDTVLKIYQNKIEIDSAMKDYAAAWSEKTGVNVEVVSCGGDSCGYQTQLLAELQSDDQPDIFIIEGMGGYNEYQEIIYEFSDDAWISDTSLEFTSNGKVYGFPVSVEAWGMAYNKDILDAAGINPSTLTNLAAYKSAFETLEAQKDTLGIDAVVSMGAGTGLSWVTGLHNFNGYLSSGLAYGDSSVIDDLNNGIADQGRLEDLADWVELLFQYSTDSLLEGNYDTQVGDFATGKTAFIHQGNWIDPNLLDAGIDFEVGYAPHAAASGENDSIFIGAPSYYVINKNSDNVEEARQYLEDLAATEEGHDYMVNKANMVPAFASVTLVPTSPLSAEVMKWVQSGKAYSWWQNDMPSGFGMEQLGPIYDLFAQGVITKAEFVNQLKLEIESLS
ncbi:MAG: extracellular solute-binding protein [Candidatus Izemoplasmatales bacterium]|nr:extracellular solute-binding protein [Candidatus Izemoplasmatales bacterium]